MKLPPSKQARWPDSRMREVPLNSARKVRSGREEGWEARYSIEESAAATQLWWGVSG